VRVTQFLIVVPIGQHHDPDDDQDDSEQQLDYRADVLHQQDLRVRGIVEIDSSRDGRRRRGERALKKYQPRGAGAILKGYRLVLGNAQRGAGHRVDQEGIRRRQELGQGYRSPAGSAD
jgi:hypothetical protein